MALFHQNLHRAAACLNIKRLSWLKVRKTNTLKKISDFRLRSDTADELEQGTPCTKFAVSAGFFYLLIA